MNMKEYTIALKVEVDELYSVAASSEEEALEKFAKGDYEEISVHDNPIQIEEPRILS